ncbi:MAG: Prolyl 4-hydroxylase alpha subunit [Bacteroidota bacterium]|nr:Prolyl 4-hydroxylase alpha subunit [Bacteroidota bacterium]
MQKIFDTLIDSFILDKVGLAENFLSVGLAADLKANLLALFAAKQLHLAGTGNTTPDITDNTIRGDSIYWLDPSHNDPFENAFFTLMDTFVAYLNRTCYTGITGYEFHYTRYETGSFYKKHLDQFKDNDSRKYSMIMYLNTDWEKENGGELCIHHQNSLQYILPESGKIVFFKSSELLHEVLVATKTRLSITGWLKVG